MSHIFSSPDVIRTLGVMSRSIDDYANAIRLEERDRIIALLESTKDMTTIEGGQLVNYADHAIALIKEETNE